MSAARYSGTGAQAASANSARSPVSDGPPLAQPFGRAPYVGNTTEAVLFRGGGKIFAGIELSRWFPEADDELGHKQRGADFPAPPFPSRRPHTRKGASDYPVPRRSCSAHFNASIWNGFLRVGRSR